MKVAILDSNGEYVDRVRRSFENLYGDQIQAKGYYEWEENEQEILEFSPDVILKGSSIRVDSSVIACAVAILTQERGEERENYVYQWQSTKEIYGRLEVLIQEYADRIAQREKVRLERERMEAERLEAERLERERIEAERMKAERLEAERLERERMEAERLEAERLERERMEAERLEAERLERERMEAERLEAERLERERIEAERMKAERLEAERLERERIEAERLEAECLEEAQLEVEDAEDEDQEPVAVNSQIIVFMGAYPKSGCSTAALGFAQKMAWMDKKTLYLNWHEHNINDYFAEITTEYDLADVLNFIGNKEVDINEIISDSLCMDESNICYFRNEFCYKEANRMDAWTLKALLAVLKARKEFDYIVIDTALSSGDIGQLLCRVAHKVVFTTNGTEEANRLFVRMQYVLDVVFRSNQWNLDEKSRVLYTCFRSPDSKLLSNSPVQMLGGIPYFDNKPLNEIVTVISNMDILNWLM